MVAQCTGRVRPDDIFLPKQRNRSGGSHVLRPTSTTQRVPALLSPVFHLSRHAPDDHLQRVLPKHGQWGSLKKAWASDRGQSVTVFDKVRPVENERKCDVR